ncbi:MAG: hypothetical protein JWR15_2410 [Prosthecobacter sp.]|nr:hypothetical protein [Prosthecobacter sp.]
MKSFLILTTLALASVASAAEGTKTQSGNGIAPAPDMNLYSAAPEPSHAMLLMIGIAGLAVRRRR